MSALRDIEWVPSIQRVLSTSKRLTAQLLLSSCIDPQKLAQDAVRTSIDTHLCTPTALWPAANHTNFHFINERISGEYRHRLRLASSHSRTVIALPVLCLHYTNTQVTVCKESLLPHQHQTRTSRRAHADLPLSDSFRPFWRLSPAPSAGLGPSGSHGPSWITLLARTTSGFCQRRCEMWCVAGVLF